MISAGGGFEIQLQARNAFERDDSGDCNLVSYVKVCNVNYVRLQCGRKRPRACPGKTEKYREGGSVTLVRGQRCVNVRHETNHEQPAKT
jgi:hypothetical protein